MQESDFVFKVNIPGSINSLSNVNIDVLPNLAYYVVVSKPYTKFGECQIALTGFLQALVSNQDAATRPSLVIKTNPQITGSEPEDDGIVWEPNIIAKTYLVDQKHIKDGQIRYSISGIVECSKK